MEFYKMQGAGNDFIFIEDFNYKIKDECELAKKVCNRHFGIGADGLIIVRKSQNSMAKMVIINSDGSRANMCGNAIRCFGKYVYENKIINKTKFSVETGDGVKEIELTLKENKVEYVKVYMGKPCFDGKYIPLNNLDSLIDKEIVVDNETYNMTTLLIGVPHTVIFEENKEYEVNLGEKIEKFNLFKEGTNVNFVKVNDDKHIRVNTWERGAGATLACGTGCCASAVVAKKLGYVSGEKIFVKAPGGTLIIEVLEDGVYMSGPAEFICKGNIIL
ncbi:diaminopimelate epimerase [Clostridium taeniosporum]|uniref:Diaminopimelate epimerase n=1 Tax=Clostridium taeniosporum TaxID=394958 RepID=A0A1D7XKR4_9CLOT|nr:diaminopimelate epimerase [Clostridium taeniosporum]AOR23928.1 diaminopimelate epimerase [Clostridium taeniosporum]